MKLNKYIWIGGIIGFVLGLIQFFCLAFFNNFSDLLNGALVPFIILVFIGVFLGILFEKRLYIPFLVFIITFLITAIVNITIWEKGSKFYHIILSIPTLDSLFGAFMSLLFITLFTYGTGLLIIGIFCFGVAYFSSRSIENKTIKIIYIILIVSQILVLFYAIVLKIGIFRGLT